MEIKMTDAAIVAALEILKNEIAGQSEDEEKYTCIRVKVVGGGCGGFTYDMSLEIRSAFVAGRDMAFEFGGEDKLKLFVDKFSMQYIDGTEIDFVDNGLQGRGFKFSNPNTKTTCGCGSSFSA